MKLKYARVGGVLAGVFLSACSVSSIDTWYSVRLLTPIISNSNWSFRFMEISATNERNKLGARVWIFGNGCDTYLLIC